MYIKPLFFEIPHIQTTADTPLLEIIKIKIPDTTTRLVARYCRSPFQWPHHPEESDIYLQTVSIMAGTPKKDRCKPQHPLSSPLRQRRPPTWGDTAGLKSSETAKTRSVATPERSAMNELLSRTTEPLSPRALKYPNENVSPYNPVETFLNNLSHLSYAQAVCDTESRHVDIFGNNMEVRYPDVSVKMNDAQVDVRSKTKKTKAPYLVSRTEREMHRAERKFTIEARRLALLRDSPLPAPPKTVHSAKSMSIRPLKQSSGNAEDTRLQNVETNGPCPSSERRIPSRTVYPLEYLKSLEPIRGKAGFPIRDKVTKTGSPAPVERRRISLTDHALESFKPLERITGDAEDLDLEKRIRSALSHRSRRHSPEKTSIKSVRWDPAIVSCGVESTPLSAKSEPTFPKEKEIELKDCIPAVLSLKKNDQHKLRELLEALSKIDGDSSVAEFERTAESKGNGSLNPKAPEFHIISVPRNHPRPRLSTDQQAPLPICSLSIPEATPLPIWARTPPFGNQHPPVQTKAANKMHVDDENAHGREAKSIDPVWAHSLLEKFTVRYPLTGKLKAAPPSAAKGRLAAAIQQRLEYLLLQEKEKRAFEGKEKKCF